MCSRSHLAEELGKCGDTVVIVNVRRVVSSSESVLGHIIPRVITYAKGAYRTNLLLSNAVFGSICPNFTLRVCFSSPPSE